MPVVTSHDDFMARLLAEVVHVARQDLRTTSDGGPIVAHLHPMQDALVFRTRDAELTVPDLVLVTDGPDGVRQDVLAAVPMLFPRQASLAEMLEWRRAGVF